MLLTASVCFVSPPKASHSELITDGVFSFFKTAPEEIEDGIKTHLLAHQGEK